MYFKQNRKLRMCLRKKIQNSSRFYLVENKMAESIQKSSRTCNNKHWGEAKMFLTYSYNANYPRQLSRTYLLKCDNYGGKMLSLYKTKFKKFLIYSCFKVSRRVVDLNTDQIILMHRFDESKQCLNSLCSVKIKW